MGLPVGSLVSFTVAGEAKGVVTKDDVLAVVVAALRDDWSLNVLASSIDAGNVAWNAVTFQWFHFAYTAQLTVSVTDDSFSSVDDLVTAVRDEFADAAGSDPTGIQAQQTNKAPAIGNPANGAGFLDGLTAVLATLHGDVLLVLGVLVLAIIAIAWGKNIKVAALV